MSGKRVSNGVIGGISGAVAGGIGILWCISLWNFVLDINNYHNALNLSWTFLVPIPSTTYLAYFGLISTMLVPYPSDALVLIFSVLLAILLIAFGVLTGRGFYNSFLKGEGVSGIFPAVMGTNFAIVAGILIVLGLVSQNTMFEINYWIAYDVIGVTPLRLPVISLIWLGLAFLGIAMISLGWIGIKYSKQFGQRSFLASGVVSTVGGLALLLNVLLPLFLPIYDKFILGYIQTATFGTGLPNTVLQAVIIGTIVSHFLSIAGFSLLIVASILWTWFFLTSSSSK